MITKLGTASKLTKGEDGLVTEDATYGGSSGKVRFAEAFID